MDYQEVFVYSIKSQELFSAGISSCPSTLDLLKWEHNQQLLFCAMRICINNPNTTLKILHAHQFAKHMRLAHTWVFYWVVGLTYRHRSTHCHCRCLWSCHWNQNQNQSYYQNCSHNRLAYSYLLNLLSDLTLASLAVTNNEIYSLQQLNTTITLLYGGVLQWGYMMSFTSV